MYVKCKDDLIWLNRFQGVSNANAIHRLRNLANAQWSQSHCHLSYWKFACRIFANLHFYIIELFTSLMTLIFQNWRHFWTRITQREREKEKKHGVIHSAAFVYMFAAGIETFQSCRLNWNCAATAGFHISFNAHQNLVFSEILSAFNTIKMRRMAVSFLLRQLSKLLFMCWVLKLPAFDKCSNCECINAILNNIVIHWNEIDLLLDPILKWFRKMSMMLATDEIPNFHCLSNSQLMNTCLLSATQTYTSKIGLNPDSMWPFPTFHTFNFRYYVIWCPHLARTSSNLQIYMSSFLFALFPMDGWREMRINYDTSMKRRCGTEFKRNPSNGWTQF